MTLECYRSEGCKQPTFYFIRKFYSFVLKLKTDTVVSITINTLLTRQAYLNSPHVTIGQKSFKAIICRYL